tara:strand:+ start:158 stop:373 length:216 start_codon:yes stop_codon:yes gene_type:complete
MVLMKDPKVTELVKQFNKDVAAINKTWAALHKHDVYINAAVKGTSSYTEPKYVEVTEITQRVKYLKENQDA